MNYLTTATALSSVGSFIGNRIVRYASDNKPSLKKFNPHDCLAVGVGAVTPVILAHIFKSSLRSITEFHGISSFLVAGALTYLFSEKEKDSDLKEVTELLNSFSQKIHNNIEEIFDKDNPEKDEIKSNFSYIMSRYKEKYKNKFLTKHKDKFLTKEKITEDINAISNSLEQLKKAHQAFNQYYDNTDFDNFDLTDQTIIEVGDRYIETCNNFIKSFKNSIFARSMCDTMKYILNTNTNKFAEIRKKIKATREEYEMYKHVKHVKHVNALINRLENLKDNSDNNHDFNFPPDPIDLVQENINLETLRRAVGDNNNITDNEPKN